MNIKIGSLYSYNMNAMVWPLENAETSTDMDPEITKNTPFAVLGLVIPKGFTGEVLKVLTIDGLLGYVGYVPLSLKEVVVM